MPYTQEQLKKAFDAAQAAGDQDAARAIANEYHNTIVNPDFGAADAYGKGMVKGAIGMGLDVPGIGTPSVGELDPAFKKRIMASDPRHPIAEGLGRLTGPMLAGPLGMQAAASENLGIGLADLEKKLLAEFGPGAKSTIARIMDWAKGPATGAAKSAASSGMQPTESGSLKSHAENAALGTIEGPLEIAGRGVRKFAGPVGRQAITHASMAPVYAAAHQLGVSPGWVVPWATLHGWSHSPLSNLGAKWAESAVRGTQRQLEGVPLRAGVGAAIGQEDLPGSTP